MPFPLSLQQSDYETLIELARRGTLNDAGQVKQEEALALNSWLKDLEVRNGIQRYAVWVQWQEQGASLPAGTTFPEVWPPELRFYLALVTRPIARSDVNTMLGARAINPTNILVTRDPAAKVGWTEIDVFFQ